METRLEGAVPATQHRVPRTPRHHRKTLLRGAHSGRAEEKLPAVLLEKHPRVAPAFGALRLDIRGSGFLRLCRTGAGEDRCDGDLARVPAASGGRPFAMARTH